MNIGLFFGSFNPVHVGHLIIANYVFEYSSVNQVWFVVTPHNPLKNKASLLDDYDRLHLVELAIASNDNFRVNNIEFNLPQPSYTIDTLTYLQEKYPKYTFFLIMGSDNYNSIDKWKNYETILKFYSIIVYERPGHKISRPPFENLTVVRDMPLLHISSSRIRQIIKDNKSVKYLVPEQVEQYIKEMNLYK